MTLIANTLIEIERYLTAHASVLGAREKHNMAEQRAIARKMLQVVSSSQGASGLFSQPLPPPFSAEALGVFALDQLIALEQQIAQLRFQFYPLAQVKQRPTLSRDALLSLGIRVQEPSESRWGDAHEKIKRAWLDHQCTKQESILLQHPSLRAYSAIGIGSLVKAWQAVCMIEQLYVQLLAQYEQHKPVVGDSEPLPSDPGLGYQLVHSEQAAGLLKTLKAELHAAQSYLLTLLYEQCQMIQAIGLSEESLLSFHYKRLLETERSVLAHTLADRSALIGGAVFFKPQPRMTGAGLNELIALIVYIKSHGLLSQQDRAQLNQMTRIPWVAHYLADRFFFSYEHFQLDVAVPSALAWPHWLFRGSYVRYQLFFRQPNSLYLELIRDKLNRSGSEVSNELDWVRQEMRRVQVYQAMLWPWFFGQTIGILQIYQALLAHLQARLLAYSVQSFRSCYGVPSDFEANPEPEVSAAHIARLSKEKQALLTRIASSSVPLNVQSDYQVQVNVAANAYVQQGRLALANRLILAAKAMRNKEAWDSTQCLPIWQEEADRNTYKMMHALIEQRYEELVPLALLTEIRVFFSAAIEDGLALEASGQDRLMQIEQAFFQVHWLPFMYAYDAPASRAFAEFEAHVHAHLSEPCYRSRLAYIALIKGHRDHYNEALILLFKACLAQRAFSAQTLASVVQDLQLSRLFPALSWASLQSQLIQVQHPSLPALLSHYVTEHMAGPDGLDVLIQRVCSPEVFCIYIEKYFLHCLRQGIACLVDETVLLQHASLIAQHNTVQTALNERLAHLIDRLAEPTQEELGELIEEMIGFRHIAERYMPCFDSAPLEAAVRAVLTRFLDWSGWQTYVWSAKAGVFNCRYQAWMHHLACEVLLTLQTGAEKASPQPPVFSGEAVQSIYALLRDSIVTHAPTRDLYAVFLKQQITPLFERVSRTGVVDLSRYAWLDFILSHPASADCLTLSTALRAQWSQVVKAKAEQEVRVHQVNQLICAIQGDFFENLSESFDGVLVSAMPELLKESILFAGLYHLSRAVTSRLISRQFQRAHVLPIRTVLMSIKAWYQVPPVFLSSLIRWFDAVVQCTTYAAVRQSCESFTFGLDSPQLRAECMDGLSLFHPLPVAAHRGQGHSIAGTPVLDALGCDINIATDQQGEIEANLSRYRQRVEDSSAPYATGAAFKAFYQAYPAGSPLFNYFFYRVLMLYLSYEKAGRLKCIQHIKMSLPVLQHTCFSIMAYSLPISEAGEVIGSIRMAVKTDKKIQRASFRRYHNPALSFLLASGGEALDFLHKILALRINGAWRMSVPRAQLKKYVPLLRMLLTHAHILNHFSQRDIDAAASSLSLIEVQMASLASERGNLSSPEVPHEAASLCEELPVLICH